MSRSEFLSCSLCLMVRRKFILLDHLRERRFSGNFIAFIKVCIQFLIQVFFKIIVSFILCFAEVLNVLHRRVQCR